MPYLRIKPFIKDYRYPFYMRFNACFLSLFILSNFCSGQIIRPEVKKIATELAKYGGMKNCVDPRWDTCVTCTFFYSLKEKATKLELSQLINHDSPVVRCSAFAILSQNHPIGIYEILIKHLHDTATIVEHCGCVYSLTTVSEFFVDAVIDSLFNPNGYKLSSKEKSKLDSILFYDDRIALSLRQKCTFKNVGKGTDQAYFERLRFLVKNENNYAALQILAQFKQMQDTIIVFNLLRSNNSSDQRNGIKAAFNYPTDLIYNELLNYQVREIHRGLKSDFLVLMLFYNRIAQLQDAKSQKLMETSLEIACGSTLALHSRCIWIATTIHYCPRYKNLRNSLNIPEEEQERLMVWVMHKEG